PPSVTTHTPCAVAQPPERRCLKRSASVVGASVRVAAGASVTTTRRGVAGAGRAIVPARRPKLTATRIATAANAAARRRLTDSTHRFESADALGDRRMRVEEAVHETRRVLQRIGDVQ